MFVWNGKHMPSPKLFLMGGSSGGVQIGGTGQWEDAAVGRGELCGDVADLLRSCPCLQALQGPSPVPAHPWDTHGQPVWGSCPAEITSAAWVAGGHWIFVLSLASPAAIFLHRNVSSVT